MWENIFTGQLLAILGAVIAFLVSGLGSSRGVALAGQTGAGVLTEDPSKFGSVIIMEALPSTQAIYGFVIAFLIIGNINDAMSLEAGFRLFLAGLPVGVVGFFSVSFCCILSIQYHLRNHQ
jgi:V/A-type H+-transporting ATPase subunit K